MAAERIEGLVKRDEVAGYEFRALMNQLVERMLPVGSRLAPENRTGLVIHWRSIKRYMLAIGFHRELLKIGGKALQILLVGKNSDRLCAEEIVVPDRKQSHDNRQVALERRGAEMLVDRMEAGKHRAKVLGANRYHGRQSDRGVHRVAPADPVPEPEHVLRVDSEPAHLGGVGRDRDEMFGNRLLVAEGVEAPLTRALRVGHGLERGEGLR